MRKFQRVEPKLSCTLPLCFSAVPAQLDLSLGESKSVFFLPCLLTGMYNVPIITDIGCAIFFLTLKTTYLKKMSLREVSNSVKVKQLLSNRIGISNPQSLKPSWLDFCTHCHSYGLTAERKTKGLNVRPGRWRKVSGKMAKVSFIRQQVNCLGSAMGTRATLPQMLTECLVCARCQKSSSTLPANKIC